MSISVIIPNYNGESLLRKNLPKILDELSTYRDGKVEIIIIDDVSSDDSVSILSDFKKKNQNLEYYVNKKNLGFSSTVNNGVSHATGDILLLLNTDVYPEKGFLLPLVKHFSAEQVFAVGCMDKSIEEENTILRGRGVGRWNRGFLVHAKGDIGKKNTLWVSGGSGAFKRSVWNSLGGLNELYNPFYWEDIDISYRAQKAGYKVLFENESVVYHEHDKGAIKKTYSPFKIKTIAYRNQFIFVWSNATDFDLRMLHIFFLPYHFIKALLRLDRAFFIAFFKAIILLPKVIKLNIKVHKLFIRKDSEIVPISEE